MKTLIDNETKTSVYLWEDSVVVTQDTSSTNIGDPVEYTISDLNSSNSTIVENVPDVPADWFGHKYIFDNGWKNNHPTDDGKTYKWVQPTATSEDLVGWVPE